MKLKTMGKLYFDHSYIVLQKYLEVGYSFFLKLLGFARVRILKKYWSIFKIFDNNQTSARESSLQ